MWRIVHRTCPLAKTYLIILLKVILFFKHPKVLLQNEIYIMPLVPACFIGGMPIIGRGKVKIKSLPCSTVEALAVNIVLTLAFDNMMFSFLADTKLNQSH